MTNHALVDGNKRLGWLSTAVFLEPTGRTSFTTTAGPLVAVAEDADSAKSRVASNLAWYLCAMGDTYPRLAEAQGFPEELAAIQAANPSPRPGHCVIPPEGEPLLEQFCVYGTDEDIAAGLNNWQAVVDVVSVGLSPGEPAEDLERLVRAAAPQPN